MWKRCSVFIIVLACVLVIPATGICQSGPKPVCAVLPFYPDEASARDYESRYITNRYAQLLGELERYQVLSPGEIERRLAENGLSESVDNCSEKACALTIGNSLNADYVIYGIIGHIGNMYSLDTTIVDVKKETIMNSTVTDIEGARNAFAEKAPPRNITSLLILSQMPSDWDATPTPEIAEIEPGKEISAPAPVPMPEAFESAAAPAEKAIQFGPRIGLGYSDDGVEVGIGVEVRHSNLSFKIIGNDIGFAGAFSYYLQPVGNSPYASLVTGYYWDDHDVDEEGFIYGALAGYRINVKENIDICLGLGVGFVDWKQTEPNNDGVKGDDTDTILIGEFTVGYMF